MCDYKLYWRFHPGDNCTSLDYSAGRNTTDESSYATYDQDIGSVHSIMIIFLISLAWVLAVIYACAAAKNRREIAANETSRHPSTVESTEERAEKVKNALIITKYAALVPAEENDQRLGSRTCAHATCSSTGMDNDIESQIEVDETDSDIISPGEDAVDAVTCSICLCPYQAQDEIASSKNNCCNHIYHADCLMLWLSKNDVCPMCRDNMLKLDLEGHSKEEEEI